MYKNWCSSSWIRQYRRRPRPNAGQWGNGEEFVDVTFSCMEADESSTLPRITSGRLDMLRRYVARFVLVNRMPTDVYDRRCCRHVAITEASYLRETWNTRSRRLLVRNATPPKRDVTLTHINDRKRCRRHDNMKLCPWRYLRPRCLASGQGVSGARIKSCFSQQFYILSIEKGKKTVTRQNNI